jgi:hypothetical protein
MNVSAPNFQKNFGEDRPSNVELPIPGDPNRISYASVMKLEQKQSKEEIRASFGELLKMSVGILE